VTDVWQAEPQFTKWLEANADLLGNVIGIEIPTLTREQSTGTFFVDLVGKDEAGDTIVVENQFGKSDHDHLGKLITYLAASDAKTAVWIVEVPRSEHVKAVAKLNENPSASFYLVRLEAVKIGDSLPAPKLTLIVGQTEEAGLISRTKKDTKEDLDRTQELRKQYWAGLIQKLRDQHAPLHANLSPGTGSWIATGAGKSGLSLGYILRNHNAQIELYIDLGKGKEERNAAIYQYFYDHKDEIESAFGEGQRDELDWQELPDKRAFRIAKRIDLGGLKDTDKWEQIQDAQIDAMTRFYAALKPFIEKLQVGVSGL
jgi:hypothetical protein